MQRTGKAGMLVALALLATSGTAAAAPGDVYVADQSAGPDATGAIFRVDLASGATSAIAEGLPLQSPTDMAFDAEGQLIVADEEAAAIFRVDPATGTVTEVARGGELTDPWGVSFGPAGRLFVADPGFGSPLAIVFRINVTGNSGAKTQYAHGTPLVNPIGIAREGEDDFLVTDINGRSDAVDGMVFRMDATQRTAVPTQVASGPPLVDPWGIAIDTAGGVLIADANAFGGGGGLLSLDPVSGTVVPVATGPPYSEPVDLAPSPSGSVLVADYGEEGPGALLSADPATGTTSPVATGPPFADPSSVAVEPPICRGQVATIVGSAGRDRLAGTRFADVIVGLDGNDVVKADRNNDVVCGGDGRDVLNGGQGSDFLIGDAGRDRLNGSEGPDRLYGGPGKDRCNGKSSHKDQALSCEKLIKVP